MTIETQLPRLVVLDVCGRIFMAKSLVDLYRAEYEFVSETLVPFLSANWEAIDLVDPYSSKKDGRLTADELLLAHKQALLEDRWSDAFTIKAILERYAPLCRTYDYSYSIKDATRLGFSKFDFEQYTQIVNPNNKRRFMAANQGVKF
jgi:hypothetical protein